MEEIIDKVINEINVEYSNYVFLIKVCTIILNRIKKCSNGSFNISKVSSLLFVSERTLYRRLEEKGETYFTIKDNIRKKNSIHLILSNKYTIKQMSEFLFFSSSSYFVESFKRWHSCTPKQWAKTYLS